MFKWSIRRQEKTEQRENNKLTDLNPNTNSCIKFSWSKSINLKENGKWVSDVAQSCPTLCDPMDYSPPGSSVHGILQARILEWVAISFSRGSSQPRDWTRISCVSCTGRWIPYHCTIWEELMVQRFRVFSLFSIQLICKHISNGTPLQYSRLENLMDGGAW